MFDNHFAYRFSYKLRDYVQHVVGRISLSSGIDPNSPTDRLRHIHTSSMWFDRDALLAKFDKWGAQVRADLQNQPAHIAIPDVCSELQFCVQNINRVCLQIDLNHVDDSWHLLATRYTQVQQELPDAYPVIVTFKAESNPPTRFQTYELTWLPVSEMVKIQELRAGPV